MAIDASSLLGSRQIAGVRVQHMGQFRRDAAMSVPALAAPLAGEIGARIAAGRSQAVPAQTPKFTRKQAFLAVTEYEGRCLDREPVHVLTRTARGEVVSAVVGKRVAPPLTIKLADGETWQFETPNPGFLAVVPALNTRKTARRVADLLSGALAGA
jgi:hypothetical protein